MEGKKTPTSRRLRKGVISKVLAFAGYLTALVVASAFATWGIAALLGFDPMAEHNVSITLLVALIFIAGDLFLVLFRKWSPVWLIYSAPISFILIVIRHQRRSSLALLAFSFLLSGGGLLVVPFLPLKLTTRVGLAGGFVALGEAIFYISVVLLGKEALKRYGSEGKLSVKRKIKYLIQAACISIVSIKGIKPGFPISIRD